MARQALTEANTDFSQAMRDVNVIGMLPDKVDALRSNALDNAYLSKWELYRDMHDELDPDNPLPDDPRNGTEARAAL